LVLKEDEWKEKEKEKERNAKKGGYTGGKVEFSGEKLHTHDCKNEENNKEKNYHIAYL